MGRWHNAVLYNVKGGPPERIAGRISPDGRYIRYGYRQQRTTQGLLRWAELSEGQKRASIGADYRMYCAQCRAVLTKDPGPEPGADLARWIAQGRAVYAACLRDMQPWPQSARALSRAIDLEYHPGDST